MVSMVSMRFPWFLYGVSGFYGFYRFYAVSMVAIIFLRFPWVPWFLWFPVALCGLPGFFGFYAVSAVFDNASPVSMLLMGRALVCASKIFLVCATCAYVLLSWYALRGEALRFYFLFFNGLPLLPTHFPFFISIIGYPCYLHPFLFS